MEDAVDDAGRLARAARSHRHHRSSPRRLSPPAALGRRRFGGDEAVADAPEHEPAGLRSAHEQRVEV